MEGRPQRRLIQRQLGGGVTAGLNVTNSAGQVVYSGAAETASGPHVFAWNGQDNNGNVLPDGVYKLTVAADARRSAAAVHTPLD